MILKFRAEVTSIQPESNDTSVVRLEPRFDGTVPRGQAMRTEKTYKPDGNLVFRTNNKEVLRNFPLFGLVDVTVEAVEAPAEKDDSTPEA
jgi:hypothetical protein